MTRNAIPFTPLHLRYRALRSSDQAERIRYARDALANPASLAEEFVTTVVRFGEYDNADQHFYGTHDAQVGPTPRSAKEPRLAPRSAAARHAGDRQIGGTGSVRLRAFPRA
jgi:hypothetical protein